MQSPTLEEQLSAMRGAFAAMDAAVTALIKASVNKDVLQTALMDALRPLDAVHKYAEQKFGSDEPFREAYALGLRAYLEDAGGQPGDALS